MKRNLFDYSYFIEEMKIHPNKPRDKETVMKYEKLFGSQKGLTLQDQPFYKEYLSLFRIPFKVSVPENISDESSLSSLFSSFFFCELPALLSQYSAPFPGLPGCLPVSG